MTADAIRKNLEYFGEHYTSNHLSNNGRGLWIGIALGLEEYAEIGAKIMTRGWPHIRAQRVAKSVTICWSRNYIDAGLRLTVFRWIRRHCWETSRNARSRHLGLCLPGGMPLISDISPDAPPDHFSILSKQTLDTAWPSMLAMDFAKLLPSSVVYPRFRLINLPKMAGIVSALMNGTL